MQAVLAGARGAVARLDMAEFQSAAGARVEQGFGRELTGPALQIHKVLSGEAWPDIWGFILGAAARLGVLSSSVILAVLLAGLCCVAHACFIIRRANRKSATGNLGNDRFYQAVIRNSGLPIAILGKDLRCPVSFCGGTELLRECLAGPGAVDVARALDALLRRGASFEWTSNGSGGREIVLHGTPVGRSCAVYFSVANSLDAGSASRGEREESPVPVRIRKADMDASALAIQLAPFAMALFDRQQKLALHNEAYAGLWGLPGHWLQGGPSKSEIIDRLRDERKLPERKNFRQWKHLQLQAPAGGGEIGAELWHLPGGRSLRVVTKALSKGGQLMTLEDVTERLSMQAALSHLSQLQKAMLDALEDAVAIFGPDGRLMLHNFRFEEMWCLASAALSGKPRCQDIAGMCDARLGRGEVWQAISDSISATMPAGAMAIHEIRREDGDFLSLTLSRLPDGITMAVFSDFSDLRRFEAMLEEDRPGAQPLRSRLSETG